jgi:hypothetical protein
MKTRFPATTIFLSLVCAAVLTGPPIATASPSVVSGSGDYAIIRFVGDHSTRVAFADGHIEYAQDLLAGLQRPNRVDNQAFQITMLINILAKRGYEYAGRFKGDMGGGPPEQIVMRKLR